MIWLIFATLLVVFVVGFRLLTAPTRHAAQALTKRLRLTPVHVESLLEQMGKNAAQEFTDYLTGGNESHLENGAMILLIWQVFIVDGSDESLQRWHRTLRNAGFQADHITRQQMLLALGFLRQLEPESQEMNAFREHYNAHFAPDVLDDAAVVKHGEKDNAPVLLSDYRRRD